MADASASGVERKERAMQLFTSEYGRKGCRVSDACPTREIQWRIGREHVGASADEVEVIIREAVAARRAKGDAAWTDAMEREAIRFALWQHAENGAEYRAVMRPSYAPEPPPMDIGELGAAIMRDDGTGFCLACGAEASGVEPDAGRVRCEDCGERKVYGAERVALMAAGGMLP